MDRGILKWFGHVERIDEGKMTKRIYREEVDRVTGKGRTRRWRDGGWGNCRAEGLYC